MTIVAALDLGSNSLKLTVARLSKEGLDVLHERQAITRIGEGLDKNGFLLEAAMDRTLSALIELARDAAAHRATKIACVGTAGLRGAANAPMFLERVKGATGIEVEIIDGLREAELTFRAPSGQFGPGPVTVFDLGGRSTEVVTGEGAHISGRVSIEMGSVRLTERYVQRDPPSDLEVANLLQHAREALRDAPDAEPEALLVGVSGTIISLFGLVRRIPDVDEVIRVAAAETLSRADVESELARLSRIKTADRIFGTTLPQMRADVIVAGAAITLATLERYGAKEMCVTHRGVRYGLLEELRVGLG